MAITVVLVGPTGHGKSATGNSILRREAFRSRTSTISSSSSDTVTCELQTSVLEDGRTISVIDTPGFLDTESELLGEKVKKCFHLARNRIHAILFVVSGRQKISTEDHTVAIRKLQRIFGENIINYIILVFTHGDAQTYDYNWDILDLCQRRYVYFYNKTKDEEQKSKQFQNLLSEVKRVISNNGGKPFMCQVFELQLQVEWTVRDATTRLEKRLAVAHATTMNANKEQTTQIIDVVEARLRDTTTRLEQQMEAATLKADERAEKYLKEETSELIQRISKSYEEQMTQRLEAVESRVKNVTPRLEQQLAKAEAARLKADERAQEAQKNSEKHIQKLKEVLERAQEAQKNSDEHIQKLKEVLERAESRRSETIPDFESSSFHVYDPSTYLLQSAIK